MPVKVPTKNTPTEPAINGVSAFVALMGKSKKAINNGLIKVLPLYSIPPERMIL